MFLSGGVQQTAAEMLLELVPETKGIVACFGLPVYHEGSVYNAAALACDGRLLGHRGQAAPGRRRHSLRATLVPPLARRALSARSSSAATNIRSATCSSIAAACGSASRFAATPGSPTAPAPGSPQRGADILLNPSASHFAFAKQQIRERFVLEGSRAFCVSYAYANLLGNEAGRAIYDGGTLIASGGTMLARGPRFSFADWRAHDGRRRRRRHTPRPHRTFFDQIKPAAPDSKDSSVTADFEWPAIDGLQSMSATYSAGACDDGRIQQTAKRKRANIRRPCPATRLGNRTTSKGRGIRPRRAARAVRLPAQEPLPRLRRFAQRRRRFLGGCRDDPSARRLRRRASSVLPRLADRLGFEATEARELVRQLLTCVYQSTRNSGEVTRNAAQTIAAATGAEFLEWNVDALVDDYVATVSKAIGRKLTWDTDDIALQNIQARARGPGVWLLANLRGALLLTTSNRSEAAVGYATMDGDTCGGLAPIAGIDKAFLLDWLKWMETTGPAGIGPLPSLAAVNEQQPTAELRPPGSDQTDEGDLMPYRVLDAIERAAIRDKLMPVEVLGADPAAIPAVRRAATRRLGRAVLPPLVPQPMEARALRPIVPPRRREPRPQNLVPLPDPQQRL